MSDTERKRAKQRVDAKRQLVAESIVLLGDARGILSTPQRFARRAYALDGRGRSVAVDSPIAARFCLAGAVLRAEHAEHSVPMPLRTSDLAEEDDLLRPPLPAGASSRLQVAMSTLAMAAGFRLAEFGARFKVVDASATSELHPTTLHRPMLLGLHPRARFVDCLWALDGAVMILDWIASEDERLDRTISAEAIKR